MAVIAAVDAVGFEFSWLVWISGPLAPTNVTIVRVSYQLVEVSGAGALFHGLFSGQLYWWSE
jgi:hypothetical protein